LLQIDDYYKYAIMHANQILTYK